MQKVQNSLCQGLEAWERLAGGSAAQGSWGGGQQSEVGATKVRECLMLCWELWLVFWSFSHKIVNVWLD